SSGTKCSDGTCSGPTNAANCGTCGNACGTGASCVSGTCSCTVSGQQLCSGSCIDTNSNTSNCGSCGHACTGGQTCTNGTCTTINTTGTGGSGTGTGGSTGSGGSGSGGCTNTDKTVLNEDASGYVCNNNWGIQGAWYCYSDGADSTISCKGTDGKGNGAIPFNSSANAMCLSGTMGTGSGSYAGIGFKVNSGPPGSTA